MIHLRILGGLDLSASAGEAPDASGLLSQPKPTALFVYLLIARPGALLRRDAVAAPLWPESDQRRARGALSQTLYVIRKHLGPSVVITRGTEDVGIATDAVRCDALEFRRLLDQGLPEEALSLYSGELLPSFYLAETPAFEHWLETERARLRRAAVEAAWAVADAAEAAGDAGNALRWSRWSARRVPDDETALRRMMEMHDRLGERAGALGEFDRYRKRLMAELELEPESETSALAAEIANASRRGEGPVVPVHELVPGAPVPAPASRSRVSLFPWRAGAGLAGLVAVIAMAAAVFQLLASPESAGTVAMFPLRVVGGDSAFQHLSEGIPDRAALALTGEIGPPATDMQLAIRAKDETRSLREAADRLEAAWYIDGSVQRTSRGVLLSVRLHETATDRIFVIPGIEAPADSDGVLAHRLASRILFQVTGQDQRFVDYFEDADYAVIRAYLNGTAAYRRGDYYRAEQDFRGAIDRDSSIAPLNFAFLLATGWTGASAFGQRARELAWKSRNELPPREREYVEALLGGPPTARFSGVTDPAAAVQRWKDYTEHWPDNPEGWYELGDRYLHGGSMTGYPDYLDQAEIAFNNALRVNAALAQASLHILDILVESGVRPGLPGLSPPRRDSLAARAEQYFTHLAPDARLNTAEAWRTAMALEDTAWIRQIEERMDSMPPAELHQIVRSVLAYGWPLEDGYRAVEILEQTVVTDTDWQRAIGERAYLELNAGRPGLAERAADEMRKHLPNRPIHLFMRVEAALLGDGDESAAAEAARELERFAAPPAASDSLQRHDQYVAGFYAATWRLTRGDPDPRTVETTIRKMRNGLVADPEDADLLRPLTEFFAKYLEALLAAKTHQPDALGKALAADSVLQRNWGEHAGVWDPGWALEGSGPVLIMRLYEILGDDERTLVAARRRGIGHISAGSGAAFLSSRLLVEARLAARAGDLEGARRAYTHYLALRTDPEPALVSQRDSARAELYALAGAESSPAK